MVPYMTKRLGIPTLLYVVEQYQDVEPDNL